LPEGSGLQAFLQGFREYLQCSRAGRVIGFKETVLFGKLGWMQAFVPGLKVIFLQRDPRAIVSSVLRSGLIDFWDYRQLVPPAFRRCFGPLVLPHWASGSAQERAALVAMSVAVRYELARRELPLTEHVALSLDDVVQRPDPTLTLLWRFLGVPPHAGPLQFLRSRQNASRGDAFSSFREPAVALEGWRRHLTGGELAAIEAVWQTVPLPALDETSEIKQG
jgi:hypothetical protein